MFAVTVKDMKSRAFQTHSSALPSGCCNRLNRDYTESLSTMSKGLITNFPSP